MDPPFFYGRISAPIFVAVSNTPLTPEIWTPPPRLRIEGGRRRPARKAQLPGTKQIPLTKWRRPPCLDPLLRSCFQYPSNPENWHFGVWTVPGVNAPKMAVNGSCQKTRHNGLDPPRLTDRSGRCSLPSSAPGMAPTTWTNAGWSPATTPAAPIRLR